MWTVKTQNRMQQLLSIPTLRTKLTNLHKSVISIFKLFEFPIQLKRITH